MSKMLIINAMAIALMSSSLTLTAQEKEVFKFPKPPDMLKVKQRTFFIAQVIDARHLSSPNHIGYANTGAFNTKKEAVFEKNTDETIFNFLTSSIPPLPGYDSIILKINQLNVSEIMSGLSEAAVIQADFDFIRKTPQGYFLIDNQNASFSKTTMWDATLRHIPNITTALETALIAFQAKKRWKLPTDSLIAIDTAALMYVRKAAILTDSVLKKGARNRIKKSTQNDTFRGFRISISKKMT
jgi:hypothetical protein